MNFPFPVIKSTLKCVSRGCRARVFGDGAFNIQTMSGADMKIREELSRERVEREAAMISAAKKKVAIEASVASKMERHHRARATAQDQARRDLRNKANAQVSGRLPKRIPTFGS